MKLEKWVCSLELSQKLKSLNVPQKSEFYWVNVKRDWEGVGEWHYYKEKFLINKEDLAVYIRDYKDAPMEFDTGLEFYSAFLSSELGEMLPERIKIKEGLAFLTFCKLDGKYKTYYEILTEKDWFHSPLMESKTFADSAAKMLIYLIENKLLPIPGRE